MPENRPTIPIDVQRKIFVEAGHRCACCGAQFPLERAHIVPWAKAKDHSSENLLCLCANCHQMADEDWDRKTFYLYKKNPWVNRQKSASVDGLSATDEVTATDSPFEIQGEKVTFEEFMISMVGDVVKITCHTQSLGVAAEQIWTKRKYPNSIWKGQKLASLQKITGDEGAPDVYFDVIDLELENGKKKMIYFDISEFFTGQGASAFTPGAFMAEKLRKIYQAVQAGAQNP